MFNIGGDLVTTALKTRELPESLVQRGVTPEQWNTLCRSLYPGAKPESVLLVLDYCKVRRLDPMKKACHIVPMRVKDATGEWKWRDVVMPGIYEYRTTAQRTGEYLGHNEPTYGPTVEVAGVAAPEWCALTVTRWNHLANRVAEYPVRVWFSEVVATDNSGKANARWSRAPRQMLTKCAEAAALREAFPDELGGEHTYEELEGQTLGQSTTPAVREQLLPAKPKGYDDWRADLEACASDGAEALDKVFAESAPENRRYLVAVDADWWESLKATAAGEAIDAESLPLLGEEEPL
jgi:phage recombination protein Bet